jgi:hypothetical protein
MAIAHEQIADEPHKLSRHLLAVRRNQAYHGQMAVIQELTTWLQPGLSTRPGSEV